MPKPFISSLSNVHTYNRGWLPHWEMPDATYSITYRLYDSLPLAAISRLQHERATLERQAVTSIARVEVERVLERRIDHDLSTGAGACYLPDPRVAQIVVDNLQHFDGNRYHLLAWCVMPNHVHIVIRAIGAQRLPTIVHSWKSYTAKRANEILGRTGVFWQRDYYDRIVRDEWDLENAVRYVLENPMKAGLRDWKWVGAGVPPEDRPAGGPPRASGSASPPLPPSTQRSAASRCPASRSTGTTGRGGGLRARSWRASTCARGVGRRRGWW